LPAGAPQAVTRQTNTEEKNFERLLNCFTVDTLLFWGVLDSEWPCPIPETTPARSPSGKLCPVPLYPLMRGFRDLLSCLLQEAWGPA